MTGNPEAIPGQKSSCGSFTRLSNDKRASIQDFVASLADFPLPIWPTSSKPVSGYIPVCWASGSDRTVTRIEMLSTANSTSCAL
jgi:hypothetical protein